jgi:heme-degrading monooxygenase HmoA
MSTASKEPAVIAVIFEVEPHAEHVAAYFDLAGALKGELIKIDGFISVERFESVTTPGKFVSLSFWRDEAALAEWRRLAQHRSAQKAGREMMFAGYRLRVAAVLRDYGLTDRDQAPDDSRRLNG